MFVLHEVFVSRIDFNFTYFWKLCQLIEAVVAHILQPGVRNWPSVSVSLRELKRELKFSTRRQRTHALDVRVDRYSNA